MAHPDSEAALLKIRLLKISIAASPAELDALRPLWNELYRLSPQATMFQKFQWNRLAAEFFELRERPHVVAVRNSGGAAIIPACIAGGEIKFLGEKLFDYPAPLCAGEPAARDIAWEQLLSLRLPLRVSGIREADAAWPASAAAWTGAPFVSRELSAQQFASWHPNFARQVRQLKRLGVALNAETATQPTVKQLYELKAGTESLGAENLFGDELRREFLLAAAQSGDPPAELHRFSRGEEWIAALLSFRDGTVQRFYTTWFDPAWRRYSPGSALVYEVTRLSLAEGLECDYMTGEQPFKLRLATGVKPLYQLAMSAEAGPQRELLAAA